jgi:TolB-like protein
MRRRRSFFCLTAMLLALLAAGAGRLPAQQHDPSPLIGALPFTNSVVGDERAALNPLVSGVPELLLIELARNPAVRTVEPARVRRVLTSQKLDPQARLDDEAASHVGRILGAQWVIRGTFTSDGRGALRLAAYMVNVASGQVEHSASAEGRQANLAGLTGQLAEHLGRDMHLSELPQEGRRAHDLAQKATYETTLAFARAIEARDAGRGQEAITMLQKLVSEHPEYEPAQNELARLHSDRAP